jgi:hypothetical protein
MPLYLLKGVLMATEHEKDSKNLNGLFMHGTLEGVDFTASGRNTDGGSWGASVKLNFAIPFTKKAIVKGVEIQSTSKRYQLISISSSDDLLPLEIEKYTKLIGHHMTLNLQPDQGAKFKLVD